MEGKARAVTGSLAAFAVVQLGGIVFARSASAATAAPVTPTPTPAATSGNGNCAIAPFPGSCPAGTSGPGLSTPVTDPLSSLAQGCANAANWLIKQLSGAVSGSTNVNFADASFLKQYAVVFAASSVLTVILWLLAIVKRAVRGANLSQAFGEAFGFLWLTVFASAFTPLALYVIVKTTDGLTDAVSNGGAGGTNTFLDTFSNALGPNSNIGGGPIILIFVSLLAIAAAAVLWIELLIRAAMLYVGAVLGTAVYAGLVDRSMWKHVRRWAGMMAAIDLAKPIIVIVLALATAISAGANSAFSIVLSGLAIMFLSIFASAMIYRFVPAFGDDMAHLYNIRRTAQNAGPAAAIDGPATRMRQGMATHANRGSGGGGGAGASGGAGGSAPNRPATAGGQGSGIVVHAARPTQAQPTQPPTPTPPPPTPPVRQAPPSATPRQQPPRPTGGR